MTNLLAILVSLAMLFTGATAPVAEPASRTLQLSNLVVRHNDEEVALTPYASLGVMTDGAKAVVDFFVGSGDDVCLPFQAQADENGILVLSDNSHVTLKIDSAHIDAMLDGLGLDEDGAAIFALMGDYIGAYGDIIRLMGDPEAMRAIQQKADALYDDMIDRGEGTPGTLAYDDRTVDVMNYEYDVTAAQIGALTDAVYASDEALSRYAAVYFKLLGALPEDSGLRGMDSFAALMEKFGEVSMHVNEAISEDGLNVSDVIVRFAVPGVETPLEFVVHGVKNGDEKSAEMNGAFNVDDLAVEMYMESTQADDDLQLTLTVSANPTGDTSENAAPEADAAPETVEAEAPMDEGAEEEAAPDGEGDAEDAFFFTMDFDRNYEADTRTAAESLVYSMDVAEEGLHADFSVDGTLSDGDGDYQVSGEVSVGADTYGFDLDVALNDDPIEARIDADAAVGLDDFDPAALLSGVSADAMKLYSDESVQKLIAMGQAALETVGGDVADAAGDILPEDADEPAPGEDAEKTVIREPSFGWLPEGYAVQETNVDEEYQDANCTLVNAANGQSVFIDISASYGTSGINHYILSPDGSYHPLEGSVLNEEVGDGYSMYNMDDGKTVVSVFPSGNDLTIDDIAHMLSTMTF
ncbi:MAG: hypothetical protein IJH86_00580 [Clostridia bacterium]|nr:hypothetical protein [Clostridia bacterium]